MILSPLHPDRNPTPTPSETNISINHHPPLPLPNQPQQKNIFANQPPNQKKEVTLQRHSAEPIDGPGGGNQANPRSLKPRPTGNQHTKDAETAFYLRCKRTSQLLKHQPHDETMTSAYGCEIYCESIFVTAWARHCLSSVGGQCEGLFTRDKR